MFDYDFDLQDRVAKIQAIIKEYGEYNFYISFSGGKDSTILHNLIDIALPNNNIPRVFINTGIEYVDIVAFVKSLAEKDSRFQIINSGIIIPKMLEKFGYPFKSKQHSHNLSIYQKSGMTKTNEKYLGLSSKIKFLCPQCLKYQFNKSYNLKISDKCCYKLKKEPIAKWENKSGKYIKILGIRREEGGMRNISGCTVFDNKNQLKVFKPLAPLTNDWCDWFCKSYNIKLCKLYYPPFNFKRTGCKGCPYALDLNEQLETMKQFLPNEYKQCELLWKPVYDEYRRIGFRLNEKTDYYQIKIDF
jgi:3'-phosphoadenosine 5'-phosphosulfate sulfotransferase (PAPS reductase)/FAD synthetase